MLQDLCDRNHLQIVITHRMHGTGIFTYIWLISMVNVGKYTIHGWYGSCHVSSFEMIDTCNILSTQKELGMVDTSNLLFGHNKNNMLLNVRLGLVKQNLLKKGITTRIG